MMNNENGRSMVEMLGVLAIIGVLSVAGIAGYSIAMRKYHANEISQAISTAAILAKTANAGKGITENKTYTQLTNATAPAGASITANGTSAGFSGTVTVDNFTDNDLCKAVETLIGTTQTNPLYVSSQCGDNGVALTVTVK